MLKRYTAAVTDLGAGFTLLELLIVMFLVALILGVTLPRVIISRQEAFPGSLEGLFRYAAMSAMAGRRPVTIDFAQDRVVMPHREWQYPQGIEPDKPVRLTVNASGFVRPAEILFYKGKEKIRVRIGLFGVTVM